MPETYLDLTARVYDMTPVPVLTHDWTGSSVGPFVTISVAVQNLGSASAKGAYILAGFDAGNDMLWNSKSCEPFDLEPGYTCTVRMTLTAPADEHTRLVVQIVYEGYAVDESYSEWVDT